MRAAIVKLSTLQKHGRWDVGYYLGDPNAAKELKTARKGLRNAEALVQRRRKIVQDQLAQRKSLQASGEVLRIK